MSTIFSKYSFYFTFFFCLFDRHQSSQQSLLVFYPCTFILCKHLCLSTNASCRYFTHARFTYARTREYKEIVNRVCIHALNRAEIFPAFSRRLRILAHAKCHGETKLSCRFGAGRWGLHVENTGGLRSVGLVRKLASRFTVSD